MISRFPGKCKVCGKPYGKGDEIEWSKKEGARHPGCVPVPVTGLFDEPAESSLPNDWDSRKYVVTGRCGECLAPIESLQPGGLNVRHVGGKECGRKK